MIRTKFAVVAVAALAMFLTVSCGGKKTKQTPAQREAQAAAARGFETITTPTAELEPMKRDIENLGVPCGIGIGESTDEQIARSMASDQARTAIAISIEAQVQRLSEQYSQNVGGEGKRIWEEVQRQVTDQSLAGSYTVKEIVQYNAELGRYQMYILMAMDPKKFKASIEELSERDEEFELRVKKDDMMKRLDANIAEYDKKYKK